MSNIWLAITIFQNCSFLRLHSSILHRLVLKIETWINLKMKQIENRSQILQFDLNLEINELKWTLHENNHHLGLDIGAKRHDAFGLVALLGMVAAEGNQLLAYSAAPVGLLLAVPRVRDETLHLVARRQPAIGVPALARVHQRLDELLQVQVATLLRVVALRLRVLGTTAAADLVQIHTQAFHFMWMALFVITLYTEIKILKRKKEKNESPRTFKYNQSIDRSVKSSDKQTKTHSINISTPHLRRKRCTGSASPRALYTHYTCIRSGPGPVVCAARTAWPEWRIWCVGGRKIHNACPGRAWGRRRGRPSVRS